MSDREDAGRTAFERVLVSGSSVLMNALVLRNAARIDAAKRLFTDIPALKTASQRCFAQTYGVQGNPRPPLPVALCEGGEKRTYPTGAGLTSFAPPEQFSAIRAVD